MNTTIPATTATRAVPATSAAPAGGGATRPVYIPNTDIIETADCLRLRAEMPGVAAENIDIVLEKRMLTLRGTITPYVPEGGRRVYSEYGEGDFERVFTMSEGIDGSNIVATLKNGILELVLPKTGPAPARKIAVAAS